VRLWKRKIGRREGGAPELLREGNAGKVAVGYFRSCILTPLGFGRLQSCHTSSPSIGDAPCIACEALASLPDTPTRRALQELPRLVTDRTE
jgi:hypothetical protein